MDPDHVKEDWISMDQNPTVSYNKAEKDNSIRKEDTNLDLDNQTSNEVVNELPIVEGIGKSSI